MGWNTFWRNLLLKYLYNINTARPQNTQPQDMPWARRPRAQISQLYGFEFLEIHCILSTLHSNLMIHFFYWVPQVAIYTVFLNPKKIVFRGVAVLNVFKLRIWNLQLCLKQEDIQQNALGNTVFGSRKKIVFWETALHEVSKTTV